MRADVGIIGATGYTGSELTRILTFHRHSSLSVITSRSFAGKKISDIHPHLKGICDMKLSQPDIPEISKLDIIFLALPHGVSMKFVREIGLSGPKIIDLSGDFRLKGKDTYQQWYEMEHVCPEYIENAVYGLPELFRKEIADAQLVANPGCYPTSAILGLAPAVRDGLIDRTDIYIDSKSGVTGAGVKPNRSTHFPSANENLRAYKIGRHRHTPEIEEILTENGGENIKLLFTPHLVPLNRGIFTTAYAKAKTGLTEELLMKTYREAYDKEPFVRIRDDLPEVQSVRGSNYCDIFPLLVDRTKQVVMLSTIDNLVKGAAGQAVQNMNIMMGFDEKDGISNIPLSP